MLLVSEQKMMGADKSSCVKIMKNYILLKAETFLTFDTKPPYIFATGFAVIVL